jgi:hypothetical protein
MTPEKEQEIYDLYPELYQQRNWAMQHTCMCWGIDCGDGWFNILKKLTLGIKALATHFGGDVQASQVKEKFGTLRFYFTSSHVSTETRDLLDTLIYWMIESAERETEYTCASCGERGKLYDETGWIKVRCEKCYSK